MFIKELFALAYDLFAGGWLAFRQRWVRIQLKSYWQAAREIDMHERSKAYRAYADRREKTYGRIIKSCLIGCTGIWLCFLPVMVRVMSIPTHYPQAQHRMDLPIRPLPPQPKTEIHSSEKLRHKKYTRRSSKY